ncbi:MAG TPA: NAD(+)/NADH kinase [Acidimicrobiales bacterium]|nr:NAD(+)/NADH kinase [Acidimicrobiales bacterium]
MAVIGLVAHVGRPEAARVAEQTKSWLVEEGHQARTFPQLGPAVLGPGEAADEVKDLDLLVSLGGDGTMLRAVGLVLGTGVPVLGVNFGRFGYLTAAEPDGLNAAVCRFLDGDFELEKRMTVQATVVGEDGTPRLGPATGLNDVVLARPTGAHTINVDMEITGSHFLSFAADSMILSTPTGSTGYNLSARGPIVSPKLDCLVVTPVSPHMLFDRSVVLGRSDTVEFEVVGPSGAELIVDGANVGVAVVGERVVCNAGPDDAVLVTFGGRSFETVLKNKFRLADR